ncbi:hypothetical protein ECEC4402_6032, partial [Escherichia coli EC4402]|jgi:hypothetical protein
MRIT